MLDVLFEIFIYKAKGQIIEKYYKSSSTNDISFMFGVVLTKNFLIMDNVFKYFNGFFKGLTGLIMTVLGLGVAVEILFGGGAMFGITVIDNVMNILNSLGGSGFAGLVGICVLFGLLRG